MRTRLIRWTTLCAIWCTCWLLGVLLVVASMDAAPDPPAVNPHTVMVKITPSDGVEGAPGSGNGASPLPSPSETIGAAVATDVAPDCPGILVPQMGQAADSSPPNSRALLES